MSGPYQGPQQPPYQPSQYQGQGNGHQQAQQQYRSQQSQHQQPAGGYAPHQPSGQAHSPGRPQYGQQPPVYGAQQQQQPFSPSSFPSSQAGYQQQPSQAFAYNQPGGVDPFLVNMAGSMLQQSGSNYLQKGQAFMQSKMGFLSGGLLHYHFSITGDYVFNKLLMLLVPFLRRWNYTRTAEQIAGGHKYLPPRQDVNAPDLYIPFMAMCTYVILTAATLLAHGRFQPTSIPAMASHASGAWLLHWLIMKGVLYALGIPSAVPFLELVAYAGYPFVPACLAVGIGAPCGLWPYRVAWAYGSLSMAVFMVRSMKRVIFHEARHYNMDSTRHNYVLLALGVYQFVHIGWLSWVR